MNHSSNYGDYILCTAAFIQPALVLVQHILLTVFGVEPEITTSYRVALTAIPVLLALIVCISRNLKYCIITYLVVFLIIVITIVINPPTDQYIVKLGLRFLLPVVLPCALCLISVKDIDILLKTINTLAWVSFFLVLFYVVSFFRGKFYISGYNMSFSYACLLPMMVLYNQKKIVSIAASFLIFAAVIAIGSRGAAIVFVFYLAIDMFISRSKWGWTLLILAVFFMTIMDSFFVFLNSVGIASRTLDFLYSGNLSSDSGRGALQQQIVSVLSDNPWGMGLFADRVILNGFYCHNIILEICLNFGLLIGPLIIIYGIYSFVKTYFKIKGKPRDIYVILLIYGIVPLMMSGSYLGSENLAILVGYTVLINRIAVRRNFTIK